MKSDNFKPLHIQCSKKDLEGNHGRGRYIFLTGSDERALHISNHFDESAEVVHSPRGHHLYMGTISRHGTTIDVGSISTGMGAPSMEIIVSELLKLGATRMLRLGTCGLLQPSFMQGGDLAIASGSVRDEDTTQCYVPLGFPALASLEMVQSCINGAQSIASNHAYHVGIFHTKSSLYAREFKQGPMQQDNTLYMNTLSQAGVIASEMESSVLFTLCSIADGTRKNRDPKSQERVLSGCICAVLGEGDDFGTKESNIKLTQRLINAGIEAYLDLHSKGF